MGKLSAVGTFPNIDPAKLNAFKQVVAEAVALAKNEEGTLRYEYFLSPDETTCVVLETYASSEAVLAHMTGMGRSWNDSSSSAVNSKLTSSETPRRHSSKPRPFKPNIYAPIGGK